MPAERETYYTPGRLLRRLARLPELREVERGEPLGTKWHAPSVGGTALDERLCEVADLERALFGLPEPEYLALVGVLVLDLDSADVADDLGLGSQRAANTRCLRGLELMAEALGWRPRDRETDVERMQLLRVMLPHGDAEEVRRQAAAEGTDISALLRRWILAALAAKAAANRTVEPCPES